MADLLRCFRMHGVCVSHARRIGAVLCVLHARILKCEHVKRSISAYEELRFVEYELCMLAYVNLL